MFLRLWSPDCTSPFYVHFHTDASPETGTPATPAQVSRGEHEKPLTSADNAAKVVFVAQSIQIGCKKVFGGCNLLAMSADVQEILGLIPARGHAPNATFTEKIQKQQLKSWD